MQLGFLWTAWLLTMCHPNLFVQVLPKLVTVSDVYRLEREFRAQDNFEILRREVM